MFYLYQFVYNVLVGLWAIIPGHDLGLAIILATIVIRGLMWPLDKKALHGRRALQSLQPELNKIKKQAEGDKQKEYELTMKLYKEKEINPLGASCLPILLQFPILIAIFRVIMDWLRPEYLADRTYLVIRNLPYVQQAIENPNLFETTFFGLDITRFGNAGFVFLLFPIVAAILQYFQIKMITPAVPKENQDSQQKMMNNLNYLGPGMILIFGLTLPVALSLYWISMSVIAIFQQHLIIKKDVETLEVQLHKDDQPKKKKKGGKNG
jgi:YidC/Oxa1 family membrane protein insertase